MKKILTIVFILSFTQISFAQSAMQEGENFWVEINKPVDATIYSLGIDAELNIIVGMGNSNGVHLSNNDGESWQSLELNNISVYSLHIDQNKNVLAGTGGFNSLYRLKYIDAEWEALLPGVFGNIISITNSRLGDLFVGNWGEIYKSSDFGETWNKVLELDNTQVINALAESSDGVLFAGITAYMGGGGVYRSSDNGNTWEYVGLNNKYISSLAVSTSGVLFAGSRGDHEYGGGGVYRSEDNGNSWKEIKKNVFVTSLAMDPNNVLYIGCTVEHGGQGGVFRTTDNGVTWELLVSGMDIYNDVTGLSLSSNGYLYAFHNKLFRSTNPVFTTNNIIHIQNSLSVSVYPNPCNDFLNIEFISEQHFFEFVKLFNSTNQLILNQRLDKQRVNTLNLKSFPSGLYYIIFNINGQRLTKTIVKI